MLEPSMPLHMMDTMGSDKVRAGAGAGAEEGTEEGAGAGAGATLSFLFSSVGARPCLPASCHLLSDRHQPVRAPGAQDGKVWAEF